VIYNQKAHALACPSDRGLRTSEARLLGNPS
jgi:hypothetical protein